MFVQVNKDSVVRNASQLFSTIIMKGDIRPLLLLISCGADMKPPDKDGVTALHYASYYGKTDMVREIIKAGANVNAADSSGKTPIKYAMMNNFVEAGLVLIQNGAMFSIADSPAFYKGIYDYAVRINDIKTVYKIAAPG